MMRIGQERLRGVAAMAGLANDTAVQRKPGQAGWRECQSPGASSSSAKPFPRVASTSRFLADHPREAHHYWRLIGPELLGCGLQEGHQDRDQQDVVPQGGLQGAVG